MGHQKIWDSGAQGKQSKVSGISAVAKKKRRNREKEKALLGYNTDRHKS